MAPKLISATSTSKSLLSTFFLTRKMRKKWLEEAIHFHTSNPAVAFWCTMFGMPVFFEKTDKQKNWKEDFLVKFFSRYSTAKTIDHGNIEQAFNNFYAQKTEQFFLEKLKPELKEEVLERYKFLSQFVKNKTVLDIACGSGFGSSLIAQAGAKEIIGMDISHEAINHATATYHQSNLFFKTGNATGINYPDKYFDIIVSYETIEHLNEEERRLFLSEIRRTMKDDGLAIISTPNKNILSPYTKRPSMFFHDIEFVKESLEKELDDLFSIRGWYGQRFIHNFLINKLARRLVKMVEIAFNKNFGLYGTAKEKRVLSWNGGRYLPKLLFAVITKKQI